MLLDFLCQLNAPNRHGRSALAEGLTDEHRIELGQLVELPDRQAFWTLFHESVSPLTSYRIESHTLQLQPNLFKA